MSTKIEPIHRNILNHLTDSILFVDRHGQIIGGNKQAYTILNIEQENLIVDYYLDFNKMLNHLNRRIILEHKRVFGFNLEVMLIKFKPDFYCLIMTQPSLEETASDVKQLLKTYMHHYPEGIVMYNKREIIDFDYVFCSLFGYSYGEMKGKKWQDLLFPHSLEKWLQQKMINGDTGIVVSAKRKDGTMFYLECTVYCYQNSDEAIYIAIVRDVTQRIANEKRMEYMAYYDELTDLPNRHFFHKTLEGAIKEAKENDEQIAVYVMDVNYFKEINDTLGYAFGDQLLKACARRLKKLLEPDKFVARLGGDEFLFLLRETNQTKTVSLAERLINEFKHPVEIENYEIYLSVSIGISIFPENGNHASELIRNADSALYVIRANQTNSFNIFDNSITENFRKMLTMEYELRKALHENQFELHYQPQKCLKTECVIGLEALIRWRHPIRGMISPGEFIPLAEKTGLIIEIGDWVLREACRQNKQWQEDGHPPLVVSVNLSPKQLYQDKLLNRLEKILDETKLDPRFLELEITENIAMTNETHILNMLTDIRKLGVNVSIDDFGTGYSSFRYLSIFPINKIKIDRMFMDENKQRNQAIVKSIINMSHSLDMKVIAEGVETKEQICFLQRENCDEIQGFYFSKPLPPSQVTQFLQGR
ncbi:MAG TPA: EAL domain-containing protein [Cerasibacillus sp.]|uniref:EAL domain-containing protein n=1 Tax=Cerasibacillus sp. TaxID=2498711 RepID=UPI002F3FC09F